MGAMRRATSADVAARAGVSRATVSYVLNGSPRHSIPEATRERVHAAATELGYTPHAAARALRTGQSGVVLLVLGDLPFSANLGKLLADLTAAVSATGRSLVTWTSGVGPGLRETLAHVDPQVVLGSLPLAPDDAEAVRTAGIPVAHLTFAPDAGAGPERDEPLALVELYVGALQLQHLAVAGHRKVAVLTVDDPRLVVFAANRLEGVRRAAVDLGLDQPEVLSLAAPDDAAVAPALTRWTAGPDPVTAVACYNDLYAAVALAAARAAGLDVPGDLSVIGVDDDPMARFLCPALTTLRYDFRDVATHAVALLRTALDGAPPPRPPSCQIVSLVERESVAPPPGS